LGRVAVSSPKPLGNTLFDVEVQSQLILLVHAEGMCGIIERKFMIDANRAIRPYRPRRVIVQLVMPAHLDQEIPSMVKLPVEGLVEARV
jgi:hypothetical protein